nr:glycosyltransferase [Butyrivibrio sp. VCD2006]
MNELISIIIPVYNVEKYLRECLDSVINQTYKKLEISLRFPKKKMFEDTIYMNKCLSIGVSCAKTDLPLYVYRQRECSLTSSKDAAYLLELSEINRHQYESLKERYDESFRSALFCKYLNLISRRAADVYWNMNRHEANKIYNCWLAFYVSDKKHIKDTKEKAKTMLYRHFPHLYYQLMRNRIYSAFKSS